MVPALPVSINLAKVRLVPLNILIILTLSLNKKSWMVEWWNQVFGGEKPEDCDTQLGNGSGRFEQKHEQKPGLNPEPQQIHPPAKACGFLPAALPSPFGCPQTRAGFSIVSFTHIAARWDSTNVQKVMVWSVKSFLFATPVGLRPRGGG